MKFRHSLFPQRLTPAMTLIPACIALTPLAVPPAAAEFLDRSRIEAGILFEQQPVEWGLHFDRYRAQPSTAHGKASWEMHAMPHEAQWLRFVSFGFSDQRFTQGNMPVVDVEIEYLLDAWGGISVYMDTKRGSARVAEGWGGGPAWKTLRFRVEDAFFGQRDHGGEAGEMNSNGVDIRIYAVNKAPLIRSIRVIGYDRENVADWTPLLKVGNALNAERETLVYPARSGQRIRFPVNNLALVGKEVTYHFTVSTYDGMLIDSSTGTHQTHADSLSVLEIGFDLSGARLGPYRTRLVVTDPSDQSVIQSVESLIGVINERPMAKARPGEFLYGIHKVQRPYEGIDREWLELMGIDMIRGWASGPIMGDKLRTHAPILKEQGITTIVIIDPPKPGTFTEYNPDGFPEGERARRVAEMAAKLTPLARDLKDVVTYWEIGNEPDLKAFYPGPVEEYVESFREMRAAIHAGNPDAIVMNGGLCYFGEEGRRRAKIIVDALAPDGVDAWAYHAHGPFAASERRILETMRGQVAAHGPVVRPFIQTESGMAAKSDNQVLMQAQTVIQKMVYAQSEGVTAFAWFALHMGESEWEYTSAVNLREPRPVLLAYRTMVQQLRHRRHERTLALEDSSTEAYHFTSGDDDTEVVVIWRNGPEQKTGLFQLARSANGVRDVLLVDLFGNETRVETFGEGMIELPLSNSPLFVRWRNPEGFLFEEVPSPLDVPNPVRLTPSARNEIPVRLRNVTETEQTFTMEIEAHSSTTPLVLGSIEPVTLAAGASETLSLEVRAGENEARVLWPLAWRVYARPDNRLEDVDLGQIRAFVDTLAGVPGAWHFLENQSLNLAAIAGGFRERNAAVVLGLIHVPQAMTVEIGASADWWMQVYLNGKEILSTMEHGNQGPGELAAHTAMVSLQRGNNLIAAKVLSGSGGWRFMTGGPDELLLERNPDRPLERFEAVLRIDGQRMGAQTSRIEFARPVPEFRPGSIRSAMDLPPEASITPDTVENFHEQHPDSSRWYGGEADLSGLVWLSSDGQRLHFAARVRDDVVVGAGQAPRAGDHDAITVSFLSGNTDTGDRVYRISADGQIPGEGVSDGVTASAELVDGLLIYQFTWPLELFEGSLLDLRIEVHDSDQGYPKQKATLSLERFLKGR